jgi:hypothetical protein
MIIGIIAETASAVAAPAVGAGTLLYADFRNGLYSVAGASVSAADVVDDPSYIGASGRSRCQKMPTCKFWER